MRKRPIEYPHDRGPVGFWNGLLVADKMFRTNFQQVLGSVMRCMQNEGPLRADFNDLSTKSFEDNPATGDLPLTTDRYKAVRGSPGSQPLGVQCAADRTL